MNPNRRVPLLHPSSFILHPCVCRRRRGSNVDRQPVLRLPRHRARRRLHLGRQQPDQPPDALEQRPGLRPARRGRLPARRGDRRDLVADARCRSGSGEPTLVRHGQGYTVFERNIARPGARADSCSSPPTDPVKLIRLKVRNVGRPAAPAVGDVLRRMGAGHRSATTRRCTSSREVDAETGALLARNRFNADFPAHVAFADVGARPRTLTADRTEFLGRNGSPASPAALERAELERRGRGRASTRAPPCSRRSSCRPAQDREIVFLLGEAGDRGGGAPPGPRSTASRARVRAAMQEVQDRWDAVLGAVQVRTPDPALDLLLNRWLLYQVLSCRFWGRIGVLPVGRRLRLPRPAAGRDGARVTRRRGRRGPTSCGRRRGSSPRATCSTGGTRRAARGVRTRISDDYLWLPFVVAHYVAATGDAAVLDERGRRSSRRRCCGPTRRKTIGLPDASGETATLYEHCVRAVEHGLTFGAARPAADGHRRLERRHEPVGVGRQGRERLDRLVPADACCTPFAALAEARGDADARGRPARERAETLRPALEAHAWDGALVPPRLLRRRHAARLRRERRMPDRLASPSRGR